MEVSGQLHAPTALLLGKEPPGTHWMDTVVKRKFPASAGARTTDHTARSSALYHKQNLKKRQEIFD